MNAQPIHGSTDEEREAGLVEFFSAVRAAALESDAAVATAKPALERLATAIVGRDNGQALRVRAILISLYTGGSVLADVSDLMALDWSVRRNLCSVLLAFGHGEFGYDYMKAAFEQAGDQGGRWFLGSAPDPIEMLCEALTFSKPGPIATTPRTLSEKGMAELLASLFEGRPVDLSNALQHFDEIHAALAVGVMSDFIAGRFDCDAIELVCAHFADS